MTKTPTSKSGILQLASGMILELMQVPAGEFWMGAAEEQVQQNIEASIAAGNSRSDAEYWYNCQLPLHKVHLDEYWMGKDPVTVAQFAAFVKATGYKTVAEQKGIGSRWNNAGDWINVQGVDWQHPLGPDVDARHRTDHPVTQVNWDDAAAFCQWASQASGKLVRLPTEAGWEKAAHGTDGRIYPWGEQAPDKEHCNFNMYVKDTTPVGKYSLRGDSPYGCRDMTGNVYEWCSDWYAADYYAQSPASNPPGPDTGKFRISRGGSWLDCGARYASAILRNWTESNDLADNTGFRVCVSKIQ